MAGSKRVTTANGVRFSGDVSLVRALLQRPDRGGLKKHVRLALPVQIGVVHGLHTKGPDPALVEHERSLPTEAVT